MSTTMRDETPARESGGFVDRLAARGARASGRRRDHGGYTGAQGAGRVLVLVYAILALAAIGRSGAQILMKFEQAPLAYVLSALAAVVYLVAAVALILPGRRAHITAVFATSFEFVGVLVVGSVSTLAPELFPADTVWSHFGRGYVFIPLLLPILGIAWLESRRTNARTVDARHH